MHGIENAKKQMAMTMAEVNNMTYVLMMICTPRTYLPAGIVVDRTL